jgi:hypothetical protein
MLAGPLVLAAIVQRLRVEQVRDRAAIRDSMAVMRPDGPVHVSLRPR